MKRRKLNKPAAWTHVPTLSLTYAPSTHLHLTVYQPFHTPAYDRIPTLPSTAMYTPPTHVFITLHYTNPSIDCIVHSSHTPVHYISLYQPIHLLQCTLFPHIYSSLHITVNHPSIYCIVQCTLRPHTCTWHYTNPTTHLHITVYHPFHLLYCTLHPHTCTLQ